MLGGGQPLPGRLIHHISSPHPTGCSARWVLSKASAQPRHFPTLFCLLSFGASQHRKIPIFVFVDQMASPEIGPIWMALGLFVFNNQLTPRAEKLSKITEYDMFYFGEFRRWELDSTWDR